MWICVYAERNSCFILVLARIARRACSIKERRGQWSLQLQGIMANDGMGTYEYEVCSRRNDLISDVEECFANNRKYDVWCLFWLKPRLKLRNCFVLEDRVLREKRWYKVHYISEGLPHILQTYAVLPTYPWSIRSNVHCVWPTKATSANTGFQNSKLLSTAEQSKNYMSADGLGALGMCESNIAPTQLQNKRRQVKREEKRAAAGAITKKKNQNTQMNCQC